VSFLYDVLTVIWVLISGLAVALAVGNAVDAEIEPRRLAAMGRNGILKADALWCRAEHRVLVTMIVFQLGIALLNWLFVDALHPIATIRPLIGIFVTVGLAWLSFSQARRRSAFARALRLGRRNDDLPEKVGPYGKNGEQQANPEVVQHG
jgi:hypothetical protein